jgi:hypothetical protein
MFRLAIETELIACPVPETCKSTDDLCYTVAGSDFFGSAICKYGSCKSGEIRMGIHGQCVPDATCDISTGNF